MNFVTEGALKGAAYGAATAWIAPAFFGVVARFFVINMIEIVLLIFLSNIYDNLTGQDALRRRMEAAAPRATELVVTGVHPVMDSAGYATQYLSLTFTNNSSVALNNVRFWCTWRERRVNRYEDVTFEDQSVTTLYALGRFEPKSSYPMQIGITGRMNRESRPQNCVVSYDDFDLSNALKRN